MNLGRRAAAAVCGVGLACAQIAYAHGIDIRTPQLPPRAAAAQPGAGAVAAQPGHGSSPAAPAAGTPATQAQPDYGTSHGHGRSPGYEPPSHTPHHRSGTQPGHAGASAAGVSVASPMQQRRGGQGYQPSYGATAQPPVAMVATPSAPGGMCRVQPSPDRQTLSLLGPDGLPRRHVPLGEFRLQRVVHSDDGAWAVALTKLRGEDQFAAMTLDLSRCESVNTVDLPATGEDVRFEADAVVVRLAKGERRVPLRSGLVR
jgi:hypothetical protein